MKRLFGVLLFWLMGVFGSGIAYAACNANQITLNSGTCVDTKFTVTTTNLSANTTFSFNMSAKGTFYVDWGDGYVQTISRNDTNSTKYSRNYTVAGVKTIRFGGVAAEGNAYSNWTASSSSSSAIRFNVTPKLIAQVSGSLGALFPIRGTGTGYVPTFSYVFYNCTNLTEIPSTLFSGITKAHSGEFYRTFSGCTSLKSIPDGLFSDISGTASELFYQTFWGCSGLVGYIPAGLFDKITTYSSSMMLGTFYGTGLDTVCPAEMEQYITGFEEYWEDKVSCTEAFVTPIVLDDQGATTGVSPTNAYLKYGTGWYSDFEATTEISVLTTIPTKTNFRFDGYWTQPDGNGVQVIDKNGNFIATDSILRVTKITETPKTLYANWVNDYTVTYNCGDGAGVPPVTSVGTSRKIFSFAPNTCVRDGYMFAGWAVSGTDDIIDDDIIWNYSENKTLTAQWAEPKFSVTTTNLDANTKFAFEVSARGSYVIDWGDGHVTRKSITSTNSSSVRFEHTYETAGAYTIRISGQSTGYFKGSSVIAFGGFYGLTPQLVAGISGSLGALFPTLGDGTVDGQQPEFRYTFYNCTNLTGSIPSGLFSGISGAPASYMFYATFYNCSGLSGSIPSGLFSGISGAPASYMFNQTFYNCSGLSGSIPSGLFSGISGAPASYMFDQTFYNCSGLSGSIPSGLFSGISGAPAERMFSQTFYNCSGLSGSIPSGLFSGISGTPALYMFYQTFYNCSGLNGLIPSGLFSGISGAPASYMFYQTFYNCSGLSGSIPDAFFGNISGQISYSYGASYSMFGATFYNCSNLSGYVPYNLFGTMKLAPSVNPTSVMSSIFEGTGLDTTCPVGTMRYITGFESAMSGKVSCITSEALEGLNLGMAKFTATTTNLSANTTFSFKMSARGTFYVDWGDGSIQPFDRNSTVESTYSHTYDTAGSYQIKFYGTATGYSTSTSTAAISFAGNTKIVSISGSLGALFPTISPATTNGNQPRFYGTFDGCSGLSGSIPSGLFSGISGAPASYMFYNTFYNCSGLSGSIPSGLFSGIFGAPAEGMFYQTFYNCSGLNGSIPSGLFSGISGTPALYMFYQTFYNCSGLSGSIPSGLFSGISGTPALYMFYQTFYNCSGLNGSIPSELFSGISGTPASYMFYQTFYNCSGLSGSIPSGLFSGITDAFPNSDGYYFYGTFSNCSGLTGYIPAQLFRFPTTNVNNWSTMASIFNGATSLLTKCPMGTKKYTTGFESNWYLGTGNKYAISCETGISDDDVMFGVNTTELDEGDTFSFDLSAAGTFYVDWGDGTVDKIERNNNTPTIYSHTYTDSGEYEIRFVSDGVTAYSNGITTPAISFAGNTQIGAIYGSLAELFPTITVLGTQQQPRFYQTFKDCTNLKYFSDGLFARITNNSNHPNNPAITGQPVSHMFEGLFQGCVALETQIPSDLFANIAGTPTIGLFAHTFEGCSNITGYIPDTLFKNIIGAPAISMFDSTFKGCSGLSDEIPENLFAGIDGAPAERMFYETFDGCENLDGFIYPKTFEHISHVNVSNMMTNIFNNTGLDTVCPDKLNQYITGFEEWFGGKVSCDASPSPVMSRDVFGVYLGNVEADATFSFSLSAKGDFYIDWGDGTTQEITRDDTTLTTYSHTYNAAGYYNVSFGSAVTGYSTNETTPAISFEHASNMVGIEQINPQGSLMDLFPILGNENGQIPRFYHTFRGLSNLYSFNNELFWSNKIKINSKSDLPNWPFASHMFDGMFENCVNLFDNDYNGSSETSQQFGNLFAFFGGTPAPYTFANMFRGTTNTMGYISPTMFNKITGSAQNMMQNIFTDSGLDTVCPKGTWNYTTGFESNWAGHVACESINELPSIDLQTIGLNSDSTFEFGISATGRFAIDWGDDSNWQIIERTNTTPTTYSHTYSEPNGNSYTVRIYGLATGYSTGETVAAISFANNDLIQYVGNSNHADFGSMFPTIGDGSTNGQQPRFYRTFYNCTNLENFNGSFTGNSDWEGKSSGIHGAPASHMFDGTFENCNNLNTLSSDVFGYTENNFYGTTMAPQYGISGAPAPYVFANTFKNTNISSFYPTWFAGLVGAPAAHMFDGTFDGANNLYINFRSGTSNNEVFKNITGAPAPYMFANTFRGTNAQGSPDDLFSSILGAPSEGMFMGTFANTSLNYIPEDLFAGINGAPAAHMFENTFNGCGNLNDDYLSPALFVGVTGPAAPYMFAGTFAGANIGGNLPTMFAGITGSAEGMFMETFANTSNLIGYIQPNMFVGVSGTATDMMTDIFTDSSLVTECPDGTTQYTTGFESWFDGHVACISTSDKFEERAVVLTTPMPAGATFSFTMSARGTFYVYWGDESQVETITRNNTTPTVYSHTYTQSTDVKGWEISFGGIATGYSTDETTAAISFANNQYVLGAVNLGHMFPTLGAGNGLQPRFYQTFKNCVNLQGDISEMLTFCMTPEVSGGDINYDDGNNGVVKAASNLKRGATARVATTATRSASVKRRQTTYNNESSTTCTGIFDGIYGQPVSHMFDGTFEGCTGLTGQIPASLFITISGVPVPYVFANTFKNCTGISGTIPAELFSGISGAPAPHMFESTFENDTGLTGTIPGNLFTTLTARSSVSNYGDYGGGGDIKKATILKRNATTRGAVRNLGATSNLRRESEESVDGGTLTISESTFSGISGAPAAYMFANTFKGCSNLTGEIPAGLFAGISGAPAEYMFSETFAGCSGLESIPGCLFGGISGTPATGMYMGTFDGCSKAEWNYTPTATNTSSVSTSYTEQPIVAAASNLKRGATARGAVAGTALGKINAGATKVNSLREAVMGGLTRGGLRRNAGLRTSSNTTDASNMNAMPSLFGQFTGAAATNMFKNTFRGCTKLSGYVPPKMFEGITGVASDMMTDEFDNSGIATSCPAGYKVANTGFESWWDGRVACEYVGQICVYDEDATDPYKCADGCSWTSKLMMHSESWNEFGGFPGYPLLSENVTEHAINISNGSTTCYLPIGENSDWGLHLRWNDKIWHALFGQSDAQESNSWGYCDGTYATATTGSCSTNSDCAYLYDNDNSGLTPSCFHGTCALYQDYGNCYYLNGNTTGECIRDDTYLAE